ncbi:MAG TPA: hypothetical protein VJY35_05350 [Candidatus Eisenbacteria bacterium]|nr:hypothetical protein [Candidatus Eisenbacteria bacterium]
MALEALLTMAAQVVAHIPGILEVKVHDTFGLKDLIVALVQTGIALGAAYLGARIGGRTSRDAATAAIRDEWTMERNYAIERLIRRVESSLRRVKRLGDSCTDHKPENPINLNVAEGLEVAWNLYYRVAEPIFTTGAGDFSERLDSFFVAAHTLAEKIKELESRRRELVMEDVRDTGRRGLAQAALQKLPEERKPLLSELASIATDAATLLDQVHLLGGGHGAPPAPRAR